MTKITAKLLVASSDKKDMLPAAADPKHASNQSLQTIAPELRRIYLPHTMVNRPIGPAPGAYSPVFRARARRRPSESST